jgi:hypothetical protein
MKSFVIILLVAKIGFICNEGVTALKLLEKGFSKEDLALAALLDFPFQIIFGYYAAKWSSGPKPLRPVCIFSDIIAVFFSFPLLVTISTRFSGSMLSMAVYLALFWAC